MQDFFDHIYRFKLLLSLSFFACQKDAAGAALKQVTPALGSGQQKNRLRLHPKSGGSRWLRLRNTAKYHSGSKRTFVPFNPGIDFDYKLLLPVPVDSRA